MNDPSIFEFRGFGKIGRWSRDIIITEKIDGTNAAVVIANDDDADPTTLNVSTSAEIQKNIVAQVKNCMIFAQSRTRFITPGNDNYGFAAWVRDHAEELIGLGAGRHFGEWWGRGINRSYGQADRHFSLFNVSRWNGVTFNRIEASKFRKPGDESISFLAPPACCRVVPVLYHGKILQDGWEPHPHVERTMKALELMGSQAAPGWGKPEGIVIFHTANGALFKKTFEGDAKGKGQ